VFIGIDLGTSGVKALLCDAAQTILASATASLTVSRPGPGMSEQDPEAWWQATDSAMRQLREQRPAEMEGVKAIGLSGQMHGAVALGAAGQALRPAILWNDVRASAECAELEQALPGLRAITGNMAMPGFTAPKLAWMRRHEPEFFAATAHVLLPKAWLRFRMTGAMIEDMSDASGTLWLDVGARDWSDAALAATGMTRRQMPAVVEGSAPAGVLRRDLATAWGINTQPILAGGAGDNAAGAVGLGAIIPGRAFVSLGTSGVIFATTDRFRPWPQQAVHAFCHALPGLWHQMGVTLSAAACLAWWAGVCGVPEAALLDEMGTPSAPSPVVFLPYLSGERTPHNDADIRGAFANLSHDTSRASLTQAVLEGVAFSLRDGLDALSASGTHLTEADIIGGGSRSPAWMQIIADVLNIPVHGLAGGEYGGAFGAARLARLAATGEDPAAICTPPRRSVTLTPDPTRAAAYHTQLARYRALYPALAGAMS
jgi:xylulokinase